jgi:hypothetical protein
MRLTDTFIIQNLKILSESKSDGLMTITGKFQEAEAENNNKRIYPKSLLEREVSKLQESINGQRLLGELDHPEYDSVKLSNVSHKITGLKMKGNEVIGEAVLLNTPAGQVAQQLIRGGVAVGISSRGMGTLSEIDEGRKQVNEDFNLVTFDLVADPSTKGAYPSLTESTVIQKIVVDTSKKIEEEALLLNLLKKKFDNIFEDQEVFPFATKGVYTRPEKIRTTSKPPVRAGGSAPAKKAPHLNTADQREIAEKLAKKAAKIAAARIAAAKIAAAKEAHIRNIDDQEERLRNR